MSYVTMKESTYYDSPNLVIMVQPGKVLVLKLVKRTIPCYLGLLLRIVVSYQQDKHDYVHQRQEESY